MSSVLVTSREGLFLCDIQKCKVTKLLLGSFFGIAHQNGRWYVFENRGNQYVPTNEGCIISFILSSTQIITDIRIEAQGLDNGSHQLMIYQNRIYLLETYVQRVAIFDILSDGTLTNIRSLYLTSSLQPIVNAHYVSYIEGSTCETYLHANAITVQDGLIYVSCAHLRNALDSQGIPSHKKVPHLIKVYTLDFEHLWDIRVGNEYACHDMVFVGKSLYLTSPSDNIIELDIVTKQTRKYITMNTGSHIEPRGLSIWKNGTMVVGGRRTNALYVYRNNIYTRMIQLPMNVKPCMICHVDIANDFSHTNSPLRMPFVQQEKLESMSQWLPTLQQIANITFSSTWVENSHPNLIGKMYSKNKYTLQDVLKPPEQIFSHVSKYQSTERKKISLEYANNQNNDKNVIYDELLKPFCSFLKEQQLEVTGNLYLYPPQHHLGWHTNLEHQIHENTFRCYTVFVTQENATFFLYRHPISKMIHAIPDRNGYTNIFNLRTAASPLWHAVVNPSLDVQRLSFGFAYSAHHPFARTKKFLQPTFHL
jgi:hypothetical protein